MLTLIAAWDDNRLIGNNGKMPWHISEEFKHFRDTTLGHIILMGKNTYLSLGKPLPKRHNIVISKTEFPEVICFDDLDKAIEYANDLHADLKIDLYQFRRQPLPTDQVFIIGGAFLYKTVLEKDLVDRMLVSHVFGSHEGDVYFPKFEEQNWDAKIVSRHAKFEVLEFLKKNVF